MYIPGKALSLKLKKKLYTQLSWTSKAGMEDTLQNPLRLFSYINLRYLKLTTVGYKGGTACLLSRDADP